MKRITLAKLLVLTVVLSSATVTTMPVKATDSWAVEVDINIHPGSDPNVINNSEGVIPVLIHGSSELDVTFIDRDSLELAVLDRWSGSFVETVGRRHPLCSIDDVSSPDRTSFDTLGDPDGYDDLICHFDKEITLFPSAIQQVTLTGYLFNGSTIVPFIGRDFVYRPPVVEAIVRCCITCDDDTGECSGCNGDIYQCTDKLRVCDGEEICNDCSGCEEPRIS